MKSLPIVWDYRAIASLVSFVLLPALLKRNDSLAQKQGERVFLSDISIVDEPTKSCGMNWHDFDDRGNLLTRKELLSDGVLKSLLTDRMFRVNDFVEPPRSYHNKLINNPTNIVMKVNSDVSSNIQDQFTESLLIKDILGFHSVIPSRGEFSVKAMPCIYRRKGDEEMYLNDVNVRGNIYSIFQEAPICSTDVREICFPGGLSYVTSVPIVITPETSIEIR